MSTKQVSVKSIYFIFELYYSIRNMLSQNELTNRLTEQSCLEHIPSPLCQINEGRKVTDFISGTGFYCLIS